VVTTGAAAFGIVGAAVGAAGAVPLVALAGVAPLAAAGLALAVIAAVTGGLPLDGLADTADALAAPDPGAAERARTDPRVGAAGAAAIGLVLIVEAGALAAVAGRRDGLDAGLVFVAAATASRALVALVAATGRADGAAAGSGAWFARGTSPGAALVAVASAAAIVGGLAVGTERPWLVPAALVGAAVGGVAATWLRWARGRRDGDSLGATVEIAVAATLVAGAALA
jgi:adenosylcobinamide-GDP ribazoletransferase